MYAVANEVNYIFSNEIDKNKENNENKISKKNNENKENIKNNEVKENNENNENKIKKIMMIKTEMMKINSILKISCLLLDLSKFFF